MTFPPLIIWAKETFFFEQLFPVVARTWLELKSVCLFLGQKFRFLVRARPGLIKKNSKYLDAQRVGASWRYQNTWIFGKLSNGLWPFHCRKIMFQCSSKKSLVKALFKGPKYATWIGGLKMPPPMKLFRKFILFSSVIRPWVNKYLCFQI